MKFRVHVECTTINLPGKHFKLRLSYSGIWCISVLKWHTLAKYCMQYEIQCSYFVQKVDRTENKTQPKKVGDMSPVPRDFRPCKGVIVVQLLQQLDKLSTDSLVVNSVMLLTAASSTQNHQFTFIGGVRPGLVLLNSVNVCWARQQSEKGAINLIHVHPSCLWTNSCENFNGWMALLYATVTSELTQPIPLSSDRLSSVLHSKLVAHHSRCRVCLDTPKIQVGVSDTHNFGLPCDL